MVDALGALGAIGPRSALERFGRQGSGSCMGSTTVQYLNQTSFRTLRAAPSPAQATELQPAQHMNPSMQ